MKFVNICSCNSYNVERGSDDCGDGHFGASRGGRTHQGIDIKCDSGSTIYAPFPAKVVREAKPYGNGKSHDTGILLKGTGSWSDFEVKLFYVEKTAPNGQVVAAGDDIGTMLDMAKEYTCKMTNHVHVQLYKNGNIVDPTPYV